MVGGITLGDLTEPRRCTGHLVLRVSGSEYKVFIGNKVFECCEAIQVDLFVLDILENGL